MLKSSSGCASADNTFLTEKSFLVLTILLRFSVKILGISTHFSSRWKKDCSRRGISNYNSNSNNNKINSKRCCWTLSRAVLSLHSPTTIITVINNSAIFTLRFAISQKKYKNAFLAHFCKV